MDIRGALAIHFYEEDRASITATVNESEDTKLGEILLFCLFALRQIFNFDSSSQAALSIADAVGNFGSDLGGFLGRAFIEGPTLVENQGPGAKRFLAEMACRDDSFNFQMKAKGFGFLARRVDVYAWNSVVGLLRYLAQRRRDDGVYLAALGIAAVGVRAAFRQGEVTGWTQGQVAMSLASLAMLEAEEGGPHSAGNS